jgi:hypothetical protein
MRQAINACIGSNHSESMPSALPIAVAAITSLG